MRKIVVSEFRSLDGAMQASGGAEEDTGGGFTQGGWTHSYWHDDIGAYFGEAFAQTDTLRLRRKTWQIHGGAWEPMAGDDFADLMNAMPKYVVSAAPACCATSVMRPPRRPRPRARRYIP